MTIYLTSAHLFSAECQPPRSGASRTFDCTAQVQFQPLGGVYYFHVHAPL